jgi:hypothetical protein
MVSLTALRLRAARARIAAACAPPALPARLGSILLRDDQRATGARVTDALARHGGCLLADDVGRGKTYVALAVARGWARPVVIAPAALRATWKEAMRRSGVACRLASHEDLSRGRLPRDAPDGIIVDESHHFRSTSTRRYSALATLAATARLLLLSATPLQNRTRDLAAQIALFHGARAFALDPSALASFVVRGGAVRAGLLPAVAPPRWARPAVDDGAVLHAILALPPPARPIDGGDAGVLRTIGLVRAWASSRAALRAVILRRRWVAAAIEASVAEGRVPTRHELSAWHGVGGTIQLGFASMLAGTSADPVALAELFDAVSREHAALDRLGATIAATEDPDDARMDVLLGIRAAHPGERVLAFTEFATTAQACFTKLRNAAGVGLLTAREARIASGGLPRRALLERFAPRAMHAPPPVERERVTLLVATDLLSEGVDLQDASVVVHLDLPWNPARLAQRVGRVRRPGGAALVHSYLVAPPAAAELLLDVERRLRDKLGAAARSIGRTIEVVPRLVSGPDPSIADDGAATRRGETAAHVARWARPARDRPPHRAERTLVAAVDGAETGWLAALDDGRLVAALEGERPSTDDRAVAHGVRLCDGPARSLAPGEAAVLVAECNRWLGSERLAAECGRTPASGTLDVALDRRVARSIERAPRHLRAAVAALAAPLIVAAGAPRSLGAERALRRLLDESGGDVGAAWLGRIADLAAASARPTQRRVPHVVTLIALGRFSQV